MTLGRTASRRRCYFSECGRAGKDQARVAQPFAVGYIERFSAEFEVLGFGNPELPDHRLIPFPESRTEIVPTPGIP